MYINNKRPKQRSNFDLWCSYNPTYMQIQRNPRVRKAMRNDPGVKFMSKGWWIVFGILTVVGMCGRMTY